MTILGEQHGVGAEPARPDAAPSGRARVLPAEEPAADTGGAWHPDRGAGDRRFAQLGPLSLVSGALLDDVNMAYVCWGRLDVDVGNEVLLLHIITSAFPICGQ